MNNDQMSLLAAALQRAAATMRGIAPNDQVAARFGAMQPPSQPTPNDYVAQNFPQQPSVPMPQPRPQMAQAPAAAVPMPQPRPAEAPSPMGFFARNAAMMRDPATGDFIDPSGAAKAQNDLIPKMMAYLHNKANNA